MCGISGYANLENAVDKNHLSKMLDSIKYRGPDDKGVYFDKNVALGIQRLSIIDLQGGHQPICNEDKSIWIVFNGEIYNYIELRKQLISKKHVFSTKTDTEIIVHLYEQYGEDFAKYLNGMFAFAIWDKRKQQLILGRDFAGIKPLFFCQKANTLIFGSELKTILKYPDIRRKINPQALELYKFLGYIPTPYSIFQNIYKLTPGTILIFSKSGKRIKKFWDLNNLLPSKNQSLDYLLTHSVKIQSRADVPVGVFLSGGIDSTLITYYLSQVKNRKLKTFSISFDEKSFDETKYFNEVNQVLKTENYFTKFTANDAIDLFPKIAQKLDEPLADPSLLPTFKLCQLASQHVKVVLSGDGGDELFAGYPTYSGHILANFLQIIPDGILKPLVKSLHKSPVSFNNYPFLETLQTFLTGVKLPVISRHLLWMSINKSSYPLSDFNFNGNLWYDLLSQKILNLPYRWQTKIQILDFLTYLTDDLLVKVDRASMYNSLEVRVPFLDNNIVNFAYTTNQKHFDFLNTKILLRKLLQDKFPEKVVKRGKKGLGIPIAAWVHGPMRDLTYDYLKNPDLFEYFDKKMVLESFRKHQKKEVNYGRRLWMLTVFSAWLKKWKTI